MSTSVVATASEPTADTSRPAAAIAGCALACAALLLLSLAVGAKALSLPEVLDGLLRRDQVGIDVVWGNRMPRAVLAVLIGAALGLAGSAMQALTRNPLADPGVLGVDAGAAAAVVTAITALGVTNPSQYVWFALAGAGGVSVLVYLLGSGARSGASPVRMTLAGTAVTAVLTSYISAVLLMDPFAFTSFRFWNVGALAARDVSDIGIVLWIIVLGIVLALALAPFLNALVLGEETAAGLGLNLTATRVLGVVAVTLLCGGATAAVGPIAFVGLAAPHIARALAGVDHRWSLPMAMLCGVLVLQSADIIGRLVIWPQEVGVGIVTAIAGAPVLIWLVRSGRVARL